MRAGVAVAAGAVGGALLFIGLFFLAPVQEGQPSAAPAEPEDPAPEDAGIACGRLTLVDDFERPLAGAHVQAPDGCHGIDDGRLFAGPHSVA